MIGVTWAGTHLFWYLLVLLLCAGGLLIQRCMHWYQVIHYLTSQKHTRLLLLHFSLFRRVVGTCILFVGILFLMLALLQPQWNKKEDVVHQEGRDLFIALDISRSMLAADCVPNRLLYAKEKIKQLLKQLSCERVGLIIFSGSTFVQCPLTTDYGAFLLFLNQIDAETISSGTTRLDQAIQAALDSFEKVPGCKHKLLVVVTDGEDFSHDLSGIQQRAAQIGMHICALGVGTTQGAPVPCVDELGRLKGHQKDAQGTVILSRLNAPMLQKIAQDSGGFYIPLSAPDDADIKKIVNLVEKYEKNKFEDRVVSRYEQQYPWFVAVSFICFLIEWFL